MQIIRLEKVNFIYQEGSPFATQALNNVSLGIKAGEFVVLLGHGGSGKSTLAQVIAGLVTASSGSVTVNGQTADQHHIFYEVGLVFQYPEQQFFAETVAEEVGFAARNKGLAEEEVAQVVSHSLQVVGLDADSFGKRNPFQLSGGQQRRVALAGIFAMDPQILIFDEPSAGLDEQGRRWLWQIVRELHQNGKTIIWITHDMEEAALLAQRVLVMRDGSVAADATPQALFYDREKLSDLSLSQPIAPRILQRLQEQGWPVACQALTVVEAAAEIKAAQAGRGTP